MDLLEVSSADSAAPQQLYTSANNTTEYIIPVKPEFLLKNKIQKAPAPVVYGGEVTEAISSLSSPDPITELDSNIALDATESKGVPEGETKDSKDASSNKKSPEMRA